MRIFNKNGKYRLYNIICDPSFTYDHRLKKTGHPVRSAIHKLEIGRLVVGDHQRIPAVVCFLSFHYYGSLWAATFPIGRSFPRPQCIHVHVYALGLSDRQTRGSV